MAERGILSVCATPIGNLGDVTLRVLDALRDADLIVAEDTRVTARLLSRYGIETPVGRYDEHTAEARTPDIIARIASGDRVALVSDAGTPGISDPGTRLVAAALEAGLPVEVLPGPSAVLAALVGSGLPTDRFYFGGFLPRKAGERARVLAALSALDATLVFYESPRRAAGSLAAVAGALPGREVVVARELTKMHEEYVRGEAAQVAAAVEGRLLKGEVVILVGPPGPASPSDLPDDDGLRKLVSERVAAGSSRKDAIKAVAEETGATRNRVYAAVHGRGEEGADVTR